MATLIKDTPILYGKDALRFRKQISKNIKATPDVKQRIMDNYNKINKLIKNGER